MDEKKQNDQIQLFENQKIRTAWDGEREEWYFSVVDVVGAHRPAGHAPCRQVLERAENPPEKGGQRVAYKL